MARVGPSAAKRSSFDKTSRARTGPICLTGSIIVGCNGFWEGTKQQITKRVPFN